jgi:hypothetical protein
MTKKTGKSKVRKIDSTEPEARDEGPRLLPLTGVERRHSFGPATELGAVALRKPAAAHKSNKQVRNPGER